MTATGELIGLVRRGLVRRERAYPGQLLTPSGALIKLWPFGMESRNTVSGVKVSAETALTISAVYRAVWVISATIASLPTRVFREVSGEKDDRSQRPEYQFLRRPNPEVVRSTFWFTVFSHLVLTGNAFVYVVTDRRRRPLELWPIEPRRVRIGRDDNGRKVYLIDDEVGQVDYIAGGNIVHFMGMSWDGLRGVSLVEKGAEALGTNLAAQRYGARFFSNSSDPRGILTSDQPLTAEQAQELSEAWENWHDADERAHKTAVLGRGTKWQMTDLKPEEVQMIETQKWGVTEVERFTGVPPHLMFDVEKTTSWGSGIAEQGQAFVTYTLNGHTVPVEQTVEDELLPAGVGFDFITAGLLRGKMLDQVRMVSALIRAGFEPQASLGAVGLEPIEHTGLPPVGGGDGADMDAGAEEAAGVA